MLKDLQFTNKILLLKSFFDLAARPLENRRHPFQKYNRTLFNILVLCKFLAHNITVFSLPIQLICRRFYTHPYFGRPPAGHYRSACPSEPSAGGSSYSSSPTRLAQSSSWASVGAARWSLAWHSPGLGWAPPITQNSIS